MHYVEIFKGEKVLGANKNVEKMITDPFSVKETERVRWVDIVKGMAILLTILGHTIQYYLKGNWIREIVFSFHMPLFFIMSAYTFKFSDDTLSFKKKTIKACKKIIFPATLCFLLITLIAIIKDTTVHINLSFLKNTIYSYLFASGINLDYYGREIKAMGMLWFLFALFFGRTAYDYTHLIVKDERKLGLISMLTGICGIILGNVMPVAFSMDIAMAVFPFFYVGTCLKKMDMNKSYIKRTCIMLVIFVTTLLVTCSDPFKRTYLELAARRYPLFPVCYITAIAGTLVLSGIAILISKGKILNYIFSFIGKKSLYLYCVHSIDTAWNRFWSFKENQYLSAIVRIIIDLAIFTLLVLVIDFLKKAKKKLIRIKTA